MSRTFVRLINLILFYFRLYQNLEQFVPAVYEKTYFEITREDTLENVLSAF